MAHQTSPALPRWDDQEGEKGAELSVADEREKDATQRRSSVEVCLPQKEAVRVPTPRATPRLASNKQSKLPFARGASPQSKTATARKKMPN